MQPSIPSNTTPPSLERRRRRSSSLGRALELYLDKVRADFGASHVVIADSSGLVQAASGETEECYALAAYAPLVARSVDTPTRGRIVESLAQYVERAGETNTAVRSFDVHGATLFAAFIGPSGATKDVAIARVLSGARRILAA